MAAGIVLTVAPTLIPSAVGIHPRTERKCARISTCGCRVRACCSLVWSSRLTDTRALRLIVWSFIAFHGSSGVLEVYSYAQGASGAILVNVAARAVIIGLFAYLSRMIQTLTLPPDDSEGL